MEGYCTVTEVAGKWELSKRRVQILCSSGRIKGAVKFNQSWAIPAGSEKPQDARVTSGQYVDWREKHSRKNTGSNQKIQEDVNIW